MVHQTEKNSHEIVRKVLVYQDEIRNWNVAFCRGRQTREPGGKRELEKTLGMWIRTNNECNPLLLCPGFRSKLHCLVGVWGWAFTPKCQPFSDSLWLVLFDHRLEHEWSVDNIAMCSVYHVALSRMYSNSRRNFICRMRCGKEETESLTRGKDNRLKLLDDEYAIVHCTGYIKVGSLKISIYIQQGYKQNLGLSGFPRCSRSISKPSVCMYLQRKERDL